MTFLPIVERELRLAARRPGTYRLRAGAVFGVLSIWLVLVVTSTRLAPANLSQRLFIVFGVMALGFCLLAGIFFTADCLSEEKREGTLGLLFLTDLKGHDVVLGKLLATSLHAIYGLLAVFPVLALPLLLGGVTLGAFARLALVLLATLMLSLTLGIFVSAVQRETRQVMASTFLGMLVLAGGLPGVYWLWAAITPGRAPTPLMFPSPAFGFAMAVSDSYRRHGTEFWLSFGLLVLMAMALLVLAMALLPRIWQEPASQPRAPALAPGAESGQERANALQRRQLLATDPFSWLAARGGPSRGPGLVVCLLLGGLWAGALVMATLVTSGKEPFIVSLFSAYALHQVFKYHAALEATRRLNEDKRSGALELLLVTPLSERSIIAGQKHALAQRLGGWWKGLVCVNLAMCAVVMVNPSKLGMSKNDQLIFLELFLGGLLMLWTDSKAIALVGIWRALCCRNHQRALFGTLARVMLPSWAVVFLMVFMMQRPSLTPGGVAVIFALWFGIGLVVDAVVFTRANAALGAGIKRCLEQAEPRPESGRASEGVELKPQNA